MHDLDRAMFELGETEVAGESPEREFLEVLGELSGEHGHELHSGEVSQETAQAQETYELELASELLAVSDEAELEEFLGNLMSSAVGAARSFVDSPTGRQLGGILKQAAKQALPVVGGALGDRLAPGGSGAKWGRRVGSAAGDLFGLELEGLSHEDRELEVARGFVRFADAATRAAARSRGLSPALAARAAAREAAREHAPGLYARLVADPRRNGGVMPSGGPADSGTWVRRGSVIVLHGL